MIELLGIGALLLVGAALFARFLVVGLRTRDTGTLLIALAVLGGIGALGLLSVAFGTLEADPDRARWLTAGAVTCGTLCVTSNVAMTAMLFRRGSRFGWLLSGFFITAMSASLIGIVLQGGVDLRRSPSGWLMVNSILLLGGLFWGSLEAAVTWRFLRRHVALGLASDRVARRIGFWSVASGATAIGGTLTAATLSLGVPFRGRGVALALAVLGLLAAAALWRSFGSAERVRPPPAPQP